VSEGTGRRRSVRINGSGLPPPPPPPPPPLPGPIPNLKQALPNLKLPYLADNRLDLDGRVPPILDLLHRATVLVLSSNHLTGISPGPCCPASHRYHLDNNSAYKPVAASARD